MQWPVPVDCILEAMMSFLANSRPSMSHGIGKWAKFQNLWLKGSSIYNHGRILTSPLIYEGLKISFGLAMISKDMHVVIKKWGVEISFL